MTSVLHASAFASGRGSESVQRAVDEANRLLLAAETYALVLADLGTIELPPVARAQPMQLRAVASLYLASTLEAAGLIEAADDLARLVRTGALSGDLGEAAGLVAEFWEERSRRASSDERRALFGRLFGAPGGPVDAMASVNEGFEELLLDLCEAIIDAAERPGTRRVIATGTRLAENIAGVVDDVVWLMARDIINSLGQAIAILNHANVRTLLRARTLWDAVAAIDRRFRRPLRPTLSHLRRGRAGMTVLAWLADMPEAGAGSETGAPSDAVVDAAVSWVDETLSIIRSEDGAPNPPDVAASTDEVRGEPAWFDLGRT